jgi:hypothetical protein
MSKPDDLDSYSLRREPTYTEHLVNLYDSNTLWTTYGIDDEIIVCSPDLRLHFC